MIHIPLIAFLLSAFSCSKQEVPDSQNHECWGITIDDSLYNHLSGPDAGHDPIYGSVKERYHGPVRIEDNCLSIPVAVGKNADIEYKLVWNGKVEKDTAHLYLSMINHTPSGNIIPTVLRYKAIHFDLNKIENSDIEVTVLHFHFNDRYDIALPF